MTHADAALKITQMMNDIDKEFEKIEQLQKGKYPLLFGCVKDGILYPELYEKSPFKLMVVLKEPLVDGSRNTQSPLDVDLNIEDVVYKLETHCLKDLNITWKKIAAIAYALKNRCQYSDNLSWTQLREGLSCVSLICLSKTPWITQADTKDPSYLARVRDWESVIKKQFLSIDFDIIVFVQTWDFSSINPINPHEVWDYKKITDTRMYAHSIIGHKLIRMQIFRYENSNQIIVNGYNSYDDEYSVGLQTESILDYLNKF